MSNGRQNFFVNGNISSIRSATRAWTDLLGSFLLRWNKINKKHKKIKKINPYLYLSFGFNNWNKLNKRKIRKIIFHHCQLDICNKEKQINKKVIDHLSVGLSTDRIRRHVPTGSRSRCRPGHKGSEFCQ